MIIDCHGHYTTVPVESEQYRERQIRDVAEGRPLHKGDWGISDDQVRETLEASQLKLLRERGTDKVFLSPRASAMAHQLGNQTASHHWAELWNDLIYKICTEMYPDKFVPVGMLPQFPGVPPEDCIAELERIVGQLSFVGVNLNPDPTGGFWTGPPLTDKWWFPLYEKIVELDVPVMVHVSRSDNPNFHFTGAHYMAADTAAFMQFIVNPEVFKEFPTIKFIIPHGGGAVPFHWGRYRGLALDMGRGEIEDFILPNVYFDTCVYHQLGMEALLKIVPLDNLLFGSEMVGAVRGIDPRSGHYFDDTKRYVDACDWLTEPQRAQLYEGNTRKVFTRFSH
jgi:4-oxalmesaconate hydratase